MLEIFLVHIIIDDYLMYACLMAFHYFAPPKGKKIEVW